MYPRDSDLLSIQEVFFDQPWLTSKQVAKYLGVTDRVVRKWKATNQAPHYALVALFWLTHRGRHALNEASGEEIAKYYRRALAAETECRILSTRLSHLESIADFDSANHPIYARS